MIGFDFTFYDCRTLPEAVTTYNEMVISQKEVVYFNGGTELITLADQGEIRYDAVISVSQIPDLQVYNVKDNFLYIGGGKVLNFFVDDIDNFPLLTATCENVAGQTSRNKITIAGNLCSSLIYRNGILPLLISNSYVAVADLAGVHVKPMKEVYDNGLKIKPGELIVQFIVPVDQLTLPYYTRKIRKINAFGYPTVALAVVNDGGYLRSSYSGITANAFQSDQVDIALNRRDQSPEARVDAAIEAIPYPIIETLQGSPDYKVFLLREQLLLALDALLGGEKA